MKQWTDEQGNHLEVRIGLHSGPVTAGIIGSRKFAYDIWGDTVNIASRMESHGVPGQIHVSETSRNLMGDRFGFEDRGWVDIKGKGRMRTFFLTDRRPSVPAALAPPVWHEF
jgi:class 3 adenylate cyclase